MQRFRARGVVRHSSEAMPSKREKQGKGRGRKVIFVKHVLCTLSISTSGQTGICSDSVAKETEALGGANSFPKVTHLCPLFDSWTISALVFLKIALIFITTLC